MSKQTINVGTTANDRKGDSLRAAFQKVNANFTELYTALGLDSGGLNLGAFEFTGSTITTTDSSGITIDQSVTVTSDLTVGGDIIPSGNLASTLGSPTNKFHSIYVGAGSVYLGDARLSLEDGKLTSNVGFNLTGSVGEVAGAVQWNNILSKPDFATVATSGSYDDLTDKPTIPSITGLATETYVNDAIAAIPETDLTGLATEEYVDQAVGAIVIPDVSVTISDTAPGTPSAGNLWWESDTGRLKIYYNDGTTSQWVDAFTVGYSSNSLGDIKGSVFADDSTLLVDGVNGKIVAPININNNEIFDGAGDTGLNIRSNQTDGNIYLYSYGSDGDGTGAGNIYVKSNAVEIYSDWQNGGVGEKKWTFGGDGSLTFPDSTVQTTAWTGTASGFTYSELGGTSEIGVTADVFDFGDGKTIDMQNSTVLFTGSTVSGILSLNTDYITIGVGGSINMQGSDIGAAGTIGAVSVSTLDLTTNTVRSEGDINISVNLTDSTTRNWAFTEGGDLTLPNGYAVNSGEAGVLSLGSDRLGVRLNSTDQSTLMVAKQSFNRTFDEDFTGHTFSILNTPNRVRVTFEANNGLYLKGLIERWVVLYENIGLGDPYSFEFDYSNIRLSLEPDLYDIVTNVVNVTQFDELIFDIEIDQDPIAVLAAAGKEPGELDQIALRYDYNNTVGFDIGRNKYGMSVDHEDIDIRAGRDIDLDATDDFRVRAGSTLNLHLERNEDQAPDEGIGINLWNNWNTALEDVKTWTFGFNGNLYLPDGSDLISTNDINITINNFDSTAYTWNFGNTGDLTAPGDITTGLLNVGGRFIQDCGDGTTSMRWINVEEGSDTTQILRVYTGDPKQDTEIERAQLLLNWSGNSNEYSGFTIKSFDNTDPNTPGEYDWLFQGDGTLRLPASSIGGGIGLIYSPTDSSIWLSGTNVDKSTDGNGVVLNGGQNDGTGRGGGISLFGGSSTGGTGGSIFIETGIGQGGADNGVIAIGTAYAKTITIGKASQSDNNRFFGNLIGNVENDDDITITVANDDSTTYAWNFGNTGDLTVPGDITFNGTRTISPTATSTSFGSGLIIRGGTSTSSAASGGGIDIQAGLGTGGLPSGSVLINTSTDGGVLIGKPDGTGYDVQTYSRLQIHRGVVENYEAKQDATGVVEHDCDAGHLFYHTSPDANWTVNLTNLNAYSGMSTNIVIVIEQGGTPYYPNALQIDGSAQTIKWLGNVTPTPSGNKTEIATFTIFYNGSNYNVLGSYSTYG